MEEEKQLAGEDRLSGEIVEVYRQPLPGEVVERYSRPLPGRPAAPGQPRGAPEKAPDGAVDLSDLPGGGAGCGGGLLDLVSAAGRQQCRSL